MIYCKKCEQMMIRTSMYDPEGAKALYGGLKEYRDGALTEWWVCINPMCDDGGRNVS